jgi:hypothetical protein
VVPQLLLLVQVVVEKMEPVSEVLVEPGGEIPQPASELLPNPVELVLLS